MSGGFAPGRIAIAICGRCSRKLPYRELRPDGNVAELYVCKGCRDQIDPYRLAPRKADAFTLKHPRPDLPLTDIPSYIEDSAGNLISTEAGTPLLEE